MKKEKLNIGEWIEDHKVWIGGGLIVLILLGGGVLFWRENYWKPKLEDRIKKLEDKIATLEDEKSEALSTKPASPAGGSETNTNTQIQNTQTDSSAQNQNGQIAGTTTASQGQGTSAKSQVVGKININTASASQLDLLPGIGATYAGRIIEYRNSHGGFKSIEEIKNVKGIGDKTFEKLRDQITI